jgi:hypothetical protein
VRIVVLVMLLCQASMSPGSTWSGTLIDAQTRSAIAGARIAMVGYRGEARTDASTAGTHDPRTSHAHRIVARVQDEC